MTTTLAEHRASLKKQHVIDPEVCIRCNTCEATCPVGAVTHNDVNYVVDPESLDRIEVTHVNLNDDTLAGFRCTDVPAFGIQYHPEAGPGPHDSRYLFARFAELMDAQS